MAEQGEEQRARAAWVLQERESRAEARAAEAALVAEVRRTSPQFELPRLAMGSPALLAAQEAACEELATRAPRKGSKAAQLEAQAGDPRFTGRILNQLSDAAEEYEALVRMARARR